MCFFGGGGGRFKKNIVINFFYFIEKILLFTFFSIMIKFKKIKTYLEGGSEIFLGTFFTFLLQFLNKFWEEDCFLRGGFPDPIFLFFTHLLVRVKLGYTPNL